MSETHAAALNSSHLSSAESVELPSSLEAFEAALQAERERTLALFQANGICQTTCPIFHAANFNFFDALHSSFCGFNHTSLT